MDNNMAPYKVYQYKGTPEEDARKAHLIELKLKYEKWVEEITKELLPLIYKTEQGR